MKTVSEWVDDFYNQYVEILQEDDKPNNDIEVLNRIKALYVACGDCLEEHVAGFRRDTKEK